MKIVLSLTLAFAVSLSFAADCHVNCPKGYHGGCVKYESECYCSCLRNADEAKAAILRFLVRLKASQEFQKEVKTLLRDRDELPATTLTDPETKKTFTILLKTFDFDRK